MLLSISLLSIVLSLVLLRFNWRVNRNGIYLSLAFICIATYGIAHYFTYFGESAFWLALLYNHFSPLLLLCGPFLYLYVRGTLADKIQIKKTDWLHFVPAFVLFAGNIPWIFTSFSTKLELASQIIQNRSLFQQHSPNLIPFLIDHSLRVASLLFYLGLCLFTFLRYMTRATKNEQVFSLQEKITLRWLGVMLFSMLAIVVYGYFFVVRFYNQDMNLSSHTINNFHLLISVLFAGLNFSLLLFPQVLYGMPNYVIPPDVKEEVPVDSDNSVITIPVSTYRKPVEDSFQLLEKQIIHFMETEKPFTNADFDISSLAKSMSVPVRHLYYCFNEVMHEKFTEFRTRYRVNYAKELLQSGLSKTHTIEAIATAAGFKSRSSFYNAFKEKTGMTPNEFLITQSANDA